MLLRAPQNSETVAGVVVVLKVANNLALNTGLFDSPQPPRLITNAITAGSEL